MTGNSGTIAGGYGGQAGGAAVRSWWDARRRRRLSSTAVGSRPGARAGVAVLARQGVRYGLPVAAGASVLAVVVFGLAAAPPDGNAAMPAIERYHRIAAGPVDQPGFALGRRLATVISLPVGAPGCPPVDGCGVAGLIAVAISAGGKPGDGRAGDGRAGATRPWPGGAPPPVADAVILPLPGPATRPAAKPTARPGGFRLVGVLAAAGRRFAWLVDGRVPDRTVFAMAAAAWAARHFDPSPDLPLRLLPPASGDDAMLPPLHPGVRSFFRAIGAAVPTRPAPPPAR